MENMSSCPRCGTQANCESNRLVTDSCGHLKCRNCLLADENGCSDCRLGSVVAVESVEVIVPPTNSGLNKTENYVSNTIENVSITNNPYHCMQCGKYYRSRSQKYYHAGCGNESAKRFKCNHNDCNKRFVTKSHLAYHMESHNPGKYPCTLCDKVFKHPTVLKNHKRCHQQELATCDHCQKQFRGGIMALKTHMAIHTGEVLPFACKLCERRYLTKSALLQHMQKHADKKYKCPMCNKLYQRNSILQLHMKRHSKQECLSCFTCHKIFTDSDALIRHKKKHSNSINKFRCIHCDIISIRKDNMLRHVRNMHTGVNFESCVEIIVAAELIDKSKDVDAPTPQTVENSSVIKCIGNVKPVFVPTSCDKEAPATEVATPVVNEALKTYATLENVKQQAIKKTKYDPFKHYLKILNTASETENSLQDSEEAENETETQNLNEVIQSPTTEQQQQQIQQERVSLGQPNFMHWRKKFKYA